MKGLKLADSAFVASLTSASGPNLPSDLSNLVRWYKADSFALADGTAIGGPGNHWIDQSASAADLTQATSGNRPVFHTNVFGSKPSVRFNAASTHFLSMPLLTLSTRLTIIAVLTSQVGLDSMLMGYSADNVQVRLQEAGANKIAFNAATGSTTCISNTFGTASSSIGVKVWRRDNAGLISFRENTTSRGSQSDVAGEPAVLLDEIGQTTFGFPITADLAELVVYSTDHSDFNVDSLYNNYFKPRWGLP